MDKVYFLVDNVPSSGMITGISPTTVIIDHKHKVNTDEVYTTKGELDEYLLDRKRNLMQRYKNTVENLLSNIERLHIHYQYEFNRDEIISKINSK